MGCLDCSCKNYPRYTTEHLNIQPRELMVIGESPTVMEVRRGEKMTGSGATVLKDTLQKVGLPYTEDKVYYTTAIKCAVPKKKGQKFPKDAPGCCRSILLHEIAQVQPRMILVCGATALITLTGDEKVKVTTEYGRIREYPNLPGIQVMPIMNPGVLIHKPGDYKPFLSMLQLASTIFGGGSVVDTGETFWTVCDTEDKCRDLWKKMMQLNKAGKLPLAAMDIETTGLDYRVVEFLVLGICFERNHAYVIPREMKHCAHNFLSGVPWKCVWQHGKYDKKVMWRRNLADISIDEDTMYQHYVLDETSAHDLGYLSKVYLNAAEYKYKMNQNWASVSLETYPQFFEALCERVAVDTDYTLQLCKVFATILNQPENAKLKNVYKNLLIPAANFLARVEQNGMLINPDYLNRLDVKYTALLTEIMETIHQLASPFWDPEVYKRQTDAKSAPVVFNPGSPAQMAWMVFDRLKLKPRIKKGRSTGKDILNSIPDAPPLIKKVLEYRTVQKEHSTYVLGLLDARDEDGRVRSTFNLHVTSTGRLSSKEPNVQNQPSANGIGNIRRAFVAAPGHVLAEIDYSGAELRWMAFLSKCPALSEVFIEGRNLHVETATALYGPHFTKIQKMRAKAVNFGIPYGREAKSLAEEFDIPVAEAEEMLQGWLNKYPGARDYLSWCAEQVVQGNYLETPFGRRRRFGLVSPASLHALQNEARNFPIQSSSSDLLLWCAINMEEYLLRRGVKIINLVHDSILLEIPADVDIIKDVATYANNVMIEAPKKLFDCPIPFKTDFEIGINWGDLGGCEFDYSLPSCAKVIKKENKDDTISEFTFEEWYNSVRPSIDKTGGV